jgi:polyhydroxyalkanoate synthesis regulator phasin
MRTLMEKTLDLAFGAAALTRERAQEFVDELVKRGEAARDESGSLVDDLMRRGQKQREEVQAMVRREISEAMTRVHVATHDDLARLERRIQELEVLVEDVRGGKPATTESKVEVEVLPPEAPPATTTESNP